MLHVLVLQRVPGTRPPVVDLPLAVPEEPRHIRHLLRGRVPRPADLVPENPKLGGIGARPRPRRRRLRLAGDRVRVAEKLGHNVLLASRTTLYQNRRSDRLISAAPS